MAHRGKDTNVKFLRTGGECRKVIVDSGGGVLEKKSDPEPICLLNLSKRGCPLRARCGKSHFTKLDGKEIRFPFPAGEEDSVRATLKVKCATKSNFDDVVRVLDSNIDIPREEHSIAASVGERLLLSYPYVGGVQGYPNYVVRKVKDFI